MQVTLIRLGLPNGVRVIMRLLSVPFCLATSRMMSVKAEQAPSLSWQGGFGLGSPPTRTGDYDDFLARDYVESFPLDVNALSFAAGYSR